MSPTPSSASAATPQDFDDLVLGAGMAGLSVAALLARSGRRVGVLEAHDVPGGYAHTFALKDFRFCAQVHYIFSCGEGETLHRLLSRLDLVEKIPFVRLDPEGFDHVVVGGERVRIPNGLVKYRNRLLQRYPQWRTPIVKYFETIGAIGDALDLLPDKLTPSVLQDTLRFRHLLRYLRWTLEDYYEHVQMPSRLRAILAGQAGDYLLPPRDVSFLLHVALVCAYDKGAYYPRHHFGHFVDTLANVVRDTPGSALLLEHPVERIHVEGNKVVGVSTANGKRFTARRYLSNIDPKLTAKLAGEQHLGSLGDKRRLKYEYSSGTFTLYMAVKDLDLREHGFGSHNVWHYPDDDLNRQYDDQLLRNDLSNPWLFMSTPSLHSDEPGICPPGHQILEAATSCDHQTYARLRQTDKREYAKQKQRIADGIIATIEKHYVPGLRKHLAMRVAGTPVTNERFCGAPVGNAYGAALTPAHIGLSRKPWKTSLDNLWMANATAGMPSVAGAAGAGMRLFDELLS